jgi:hypothetical protein
MMNSILLGAAMLLSGLSMPANVVTVEPQIISAPVAQEKMMTHEIETYLIEQKAAPHWSLSVSLAWELYADAEIVIQEIELNRVYKIHYDGTVMDVIWDGM